MAVNRKLIVIIIIIVFIIGLIALMTLTLYREPQNSTYRGNLDAVQMRNREENINRIEVRRAKLPPKYEHSSSPSNGKGNILPNRKECGQHLPEKIIGGPIVSIDDYPWLALLEYITDDGYKFQCGGVLINQRYVLTAAHCLNQTGLYNVRLGEYDLSQDTDCIISAYCTASPLNIGIEDIIIHEKFNRKAHLNDIGLIRLKTDIAYSGEVKPICLEPATSEKYIVGRWGRNKTRLSNDIKNRLFLPFFDLNKCKVVKEIKDANLEINESHICAGGEGQDSCLGDSGMPLMTIAGTNIVVSGIVSYGIGCGRPGVPGVYTNVTYFSDWIIKSMKP